MFSEWSGKSLNKVTFGITFCFFHQPTPPHSTLTSKPFAVKGLKIFIYFIIEFFSALLFSLFVLLLLSFALNSWAEISVPILYFPSSTSSSSFTSYFSFTTSKIGLIKKRQKIHGKCFQTHIKIKAKTKSFCYFGGNHFCFGFFLISLFILVRFYYWFNTEPKTWLSIWVWK